MVVEAFEIDTGFYAFGASDLQTSWHAHPAAEIVIANSGSFTLEYGDQVFTGLRGVIIPANLRHRLTAVDSQLMICMIEAPGDIDWPKTSCSPLTDERGALMIQQPTDEL